MRALIQRVSEASVTVEGEIVGRIGRGILVLLGVEKGDDLVACHRLAEKVISYRIFPDEAGRMNRSVKGIGGGVLVVSQFTLVADTRKGLRPSFTPAADPGDAEALYRAFVAHIEPQLTETATGRFGADMQVALINDGPVTFLVDV